MYKRRLFFIFFLITMLLAACSALPEPELLETPPVVVTQTVIPVQTEVSTPTVVVPPTPTVVQNFYGSIIYDDLSNIVLLDPQTGDEQVLISRKELSFLLGENKSADSYTYGEEVPVEIILSPDLKQALVTICAALDDRLRCVNEAFVYQIEEKSVVKLPMPPGAYGVYWQWSPDSTKLSGAAWTYNLLQYEMTRFYVVNSDGSGLVSPQSVNNNWQVAWDPYSLAVYPLTFVTNFLPMRTDGTLGDDIPLDGLEWNDRVECLAFSPDGEKVVFAVQQELYKDHHWVYVADTDFSNSSLLVDFEIDYDYDCNIFWSPDSSQIRLKYVSDPRAEVQSTVDLPQVDKVVDLATGGLVELPQNAQVCLWSPGNDLLYRRMDDNGNGLGGGLMPSQGSAFATLPEDFLSAFVSCPELWLPENPNLDVKAGFSVPGACFPGSAVQATDVQVPIPSLFDIVEVSSDLEGEQLRVVFTMNTMEKDLGAYVTPGEDTFLNGWDVLVDIDNNVLTGDRLGVDMVLSLRIRPATGNSPVQAGAVLVKFDSSTETYKPVGRLNFLFKPELRQITLRGIVPGISMESRVVFLSRYTDREKFKIVQDKICN